MPYENNSNLPESVKDNVPHHAQDIYREAFNSAWRQYKNSENRQDGKNREETAHAVAWSAVKNSYKKEDGEWVEKDKKG